MSEPAWMGGRREAIIVALILAASLPSRTATLTASLWLDESWVANSLLAASWREMFFYSEWLQTTPPLLLTMMRVATRILGTGEWAIRAAPFVASLLAPVVLAVALRRLMRWTAWLPAVSLVALNYWAVKMGQQGKQYGMELLVSCVLLWLVVRFRDNGRPAILAGCGAVACFLSFPAAFWYPSLVLAVMAADGLRSARWAGLALCLAGALGLLYGVFLRGNLGETLSAARAGAQLGAVGFLAGMVQLERGIAYLLVPERASWLVWVARIVEAVAIAGLIRAVVRFRRGDRVAGTLLLAGPLPLLAGIAVSFAGLYPLLGYSRMILWMLPGLAALMAYGLEPLFQSLSPRFNRTLRYGVPAACLLAALGAQVVLLRYPRPAERNREAVEFLQTRGAEVCIFVYGAMAESYRFYRSRTGFSPSCEFTTSTGWPCCPRNPGQPDPAQLDLDLDHAVEQSSGKDIWFLAPSGSQGHWGAIFAAELNSLPRRMAERGCSELGAEGFDQTQVRGYRCSQ